MIAHRFDLYRGELQKITCGRNKIRYPNNELSALFSIFGLALAFGSIQKIDRESFCLDKYLQPTIKATHAYIFSTTSVFRLAKGRKLRLEAGK